MEFKVIDVYKPSGLLGKFIEALPPGLTVYSPLEAFKEAHTKTGYKQSLESVVKQF